MSLPEPESPKEKSLPSSEANVDDGHKFARPQEEKQPEGSFKDYLVREERFSHAVTKTQLIK